MRIKRVRKKILLLSVFLPLAMLMVAAFPIGDVRASGDAASFTSVYVYPSVYKATAPGEIFKVDVNIANVSNLAVFQFKLGYDTTILDALEVVEGPFLKGFGTTFPVLLETNETLGFVWVCIVLWDTTAAQGDGTLATVRFECTGTGECVFDLYDTGLGDAEGFPIDHYVTDGYSVNEFVDPVEAPTQAGIYAAIADGMGWLAAQQNIDGSWGTYYQVAETGFAVLKFLTHAIRECIDPLDPSYQYYHQVRAGLDYLFLTANTVSIGMQPAGNPDADGDCIGVCWHGSNSTTYHTSIAMMAIAACTHPDMTVSVAGSAVYGWTYKEVLCDAVDYLAYGQTDAGLGQGGWGYDPNSGWSDNSNTGYAVLGLAYAKADSIDGKVGFGCTVPNFVRGELGIWIDYIQNDVDGDTNDGGSGYTGPDDWVNILKTGNLLFEMAFVGDTADTPRVIDAVDYIERHWNDANSDPGWRGQPGDVAHKQAMYTTMKGFEALGIETIVVDSAEVDWFDEMARVLLVQQNPDGSWGSDPWGDAILGTEWALLTLQKTSVVPKPPYLPLARFTFTPYKPAVDEPVTFDASSSTPDGGTIITYEWDFGDGEYATGQTVTHAYTWAGAFTVTLNVTDSEGFWDIRQKQILIGVFAPCDFNYDGKVDLLDFELLRQAYLSGETGPPGWIPEDMDEDGDVDLRDLLLFRNCILKHETVPPTTEISLDGILGAFGWYRSDVTITLTATDWGAGVDKTEYSFDEVAWIAYTTPFMVTTEGFTTTYYRSIDKRGNLEQTKSETIKIDKTIPEITITSPEARDYLNTETVSIDYGATDSLSGIASVNAYLGYDPAVIYVDPQISKAMVGTSFTFNINVADAPPTVQWMLRFEWNASILDFVNAEKGPWLSQNGAIPTIFYTKPIEPGRIPEMGEVILVLETTSGSGTLATLTFFVKAEGESLLHIHESYLLDLEGNEIPHETIDGHFTSTMPPEEHDIAITSVAVSTTKVTSGDPVTVTVVVENQGTRTETFDVTVSYDSNVIATQTQISLDMDRTKTLTFTWNTAGLGLGSYLIKAEATIVPGEIETIDNTFTNGIVMVRIPVYNGQKLDLSTLKLGKYTITVIATDNAGNKAEESVAFNVVTTLSGVVTDEYTKEPIPGVTISILETGESVVTDECGRYSFIIRSAGIYTVEMTVPYGYLTHDDVTKFVEITKPTEINFTLYQAAWSGATVPRTIGYWKNWDQHYTAEMMETLIAYVKSASGLFSDLTVDNLKFYLKITGLSLEEKGQAQLLASWLNVVSAQLGVDAKVDLSPIEGWEQVITIPEGSTLTVDELLRQIDNLYLTDANLTSEQWETIKDILDALNNGQLFVEE